MHNKLIHEQVVLMIEDVGGLYIPGAVIQDDVRGLHTELGFGQSCKILVESDDRVQIAALLLLGIVIVPR